MIESAAVLPVDERSLQQSMVALARGASIEINVQDVHELDDAAALLHPGTKTYVSHLPRQSWQDTIAACGAVHAAGFEPVPHIPVRLLPDETALDRLLASLVRNAGVMEVLLISGDYPLTRGPYSTVLDALRAGLLQRHGLQRVSLAGHPEGHPSVPLRLIRRAEVDKAGYARQAGLDATFVTQFFFESPPFLEWARVMRGSGVSSRIVAGISGPASIVSLFKLAARCGVGGSIRALGARPSAVAKLAGDHSPNTLISELASAFSAHEPLFDGLHIFSLGGYLRTCRWLNGLIEGRRA